MKRILITNAGGRLGVGFCRALKMAPEPVHLIGVDSSPFMLQRAQADELHLIPRADEHDFVPVLRDVVEETRPDLLCVQISAELLPVSAARDRLGVPVLLPRHETIAVCESKMASYECWRDAGVPVPTSYLITTEEDLRRAFNEQGGRLWLRAIRGTGGKGSLAVSDIETARDWIELRKGWGDFMAAELLERETVTWESLWDHGRLVAAQGRKRHYWEFSNLTASGVTGITGSGETVSDPVVDGIAMRAVRAIDPAPHGILGVDMAYDRHGTPKVTEINAGRFMSGGVVLYAPRGVNMAHLAVRVGLGQVAPSEPPLINPFPDGIVCIRGMDIEPVLTEIGQVRSFAGDLERRRRTVRQPGEAPAGTAGAAA